MVGMSKKKRTVGIVNVYLTSLLSINGLKNALKSLEFVMETETVHIVMMKLIVIMPCLKEVRNKCVEMVFTGQI